MKKILLPTLLILISSINVNAYSLDVVYQGTTSKGETCTVKVTQKENDDNTLHYEIVLAKRDRDIFDISLSKYALDHYLDKYGYHEVETVKKGILGKRLYSLEVMASDDGVRSFRVLRWRFLLGNSMATAFEKIKCIMN